MSVSRGGGDLHRKSVAGRIRHNWEEDTAPATATDAWGKHQEVWTPPHGQEVRIESAEFGWYCDVRNYSDDLEDRPTCVISFGWDEYPDPYDGPGSVGFDETFESDQMLYIANGNIRQAGVETDAYASEHSVGEFPLTGRVTIDDEAFPEFADHSDELTVSNITSYPADNTQSGGQREIFCYWDVNFVYEFI